MLYFAGIFGMAPNRVSNDIFELFVILEQFICVGKLDFKLRCGWIRYVLSSVKYWIT